MAKLIAQFIPRYLPADRVQVVLGAVSTTTTLLSLPWAHICYTGGSRVGRIVAKAAADHGTPCTLELGGKSPAVVAKDAHLATAARRIVWGKRTNSGQTCVAPDYVICIGESTRDEFVKQAVRVAKEFGDASEGGERTPSARIVSAAHYDRITRLIDNSKGEVVVRGHRDEATRELGLSIVLVGPDDSLMSEEVRLSVSAKLLWSSDALPRTRTALWTCAAHFDCRLAAAGVRAHRLACHATCSLCLLRGELRRQVHS